MKLAIMQPYFLPYIGYWQLMAAVDVFVVYDNIKYTKKGWINRNRILVNGKDFMFTLPLKSASDSLDVCERELAADFKREKLLNQIKEAYQRAPYFATTYPLLEQIVRYDDNNLFSYLHHSIVSICKRLEIQTAIHISSGIAIDHDLKGQGKVLALCEAMGAETYINAIGGLELYSKDEFRSRGIELKFIRSKPFEYRQYGNPFVPWLSIIDVMMFNSKELSSACIAEQFDLV
jgi:hypothetical protein